MCNGGDTLPFVFVKDSSPDFVSYHSLQFVNYSRLLPNCLYLLDLEDIACIVAQSGAAFGIPPLSVPDLNSQNDRHLWGSHSIS